MFLAYLLAVAAISHLAGLGFSVHFADAVLADQVWSATIGSITEMAFTSECAVALFWNVRVQRDRGKLG